MLRSLHIENIAVIRALDLDADGGFTAMTGETGAGKSIVIDSINFLLCNRTGRELRTLAAEGRSVCRIDGRSVTQAVLRRAGACSCRYTGRMRTCAYAIRRRSLKCSMRLLIRKNCLKSMRGYIRSSKAFAQR